MKYIAITITALGLVLGACGKKDTKPAQPNPPTEPAKVDEAKVDEAKVDEAKVDEAKVDEAKVDEAKVDRAAETVAGFAKFNAHDLDGAFANVTDDVVVNEVGDPMTPVVTGKAAFLAEHRAMLVGFPDTKVSPVRVYDAGEWVISEVVITGTNTGAFQGMEATNKPFGVAAAMAYHFNADGKVDRIDNFVDSATIMMQMGAIPAPPEMGEMKLVAAPEAAPEIIKGEPNEANVETVKGWYAAFTNDNLQAAVDKYWADDFTFHGPNEGMELKGKQENHDYLKKMMFGMFPDWTGTVENTVSVGDYVIAWTTSAGTYKGGMPGVEAADQKISSHSLDFSKLADGKVAEFTYYGNGLEFMSQLGMMGGAGGDKGADAADPGTIDDAAGAVKEAADEVNKAVDGANDAMKAAGDAMKGADEAVKAATGEAKEAMGEAADDMKKAADEMKLDNE